MRIAMWSGPRNLSTAMMYSFGARSDCAVWDEPYYAAYLAASGQDHPMRKEILAAGELDPKAVASRCLGDIPGDKPVYYQKHMPHHMLPQFDRTWVRDMVNVFLIRDPARVIASYHAKLENPTLHDTGFLHQAELFDRIAQAQGVAPVVIDSYDILSDPGGMLRKLCARIGLGFQPAMLSWPKGGRQEDGAWAPHWYKSVWQSTGFGSPGTKAPEVSDQGRAVLEQAQPFYERLMEYKIQP
jgi:sulfotransferase family protein